MNRKKDILRHICLLMSFYILISPLSICRAAENMISIDRHAPHYFIRLLYPSVTSFQVILKQRPVQDQNYTRISFDPQKPWTLFLLIESSQWTSPIQQNAAILALLDKIENPPESIETYSFHTVVEKVDTDWKVPIFLKESPNQNVALLDSMQRAIQIMAKDQRNSLLCVVGSGHNTENLTHFPIPVCPVWCLFPNDTESRKTPYLKTITTLSGGQTLYFHELEEADNIQLPFHQQGSIVHFSIPNQSFNFRKQIRVEITDHSIAKSITLYYPTPWWSLIGIVILFLVIMYVLFRFLPIRKMTQTKTNPRYYHLAWLEWNDKSTVKQHYRIHSCDFTIGSSQNCHLSMQEDAISDFHALIQEKDNGFYITDLSSRTGVWINHQKIEKSQLFDRDEIQIGNIILTFRQSHIKYESNEKYL